MYILTYKIMMGATGKSNSQIVQQAASGWRLASLWRTQSFAAPALFPSRYPRI